MKKRKIQSLLALTMVAAMLMSACGSTDDAVTNSSEAEKESAAGSSVEESTTEAEEVDPYAEHVKLTLWTDMTEPEIRAQTPFLEEKFNVDLEFQCISSSDRSTQFNLMMESGDFPDMVLGSLSVAQVQAGINAGAFIPLNDYIVEGTEFQEILDLFPEYEKYLTTNDGNIYTFMVTDMGMHIPCQYKMWYRVDYLENIGWDAPPTTPEEFKQFLIDIRDKDANGNGDPDDEIPLMGHLNAAWTNPDPICFLMNPFELYTNNYYYITDDGEIHFSAVTDGWRKGLAYIADLYAEGLIAEETYVQDNATFGALLNQANPEDAVIGTFPFWYQGGAINNSSMSWLTYEAIAPLKGDYQQAADSGASFGMNSAITTACENPDRAFAIMDYLLSEEGTYLTLYGIEGEGYEWVNDKENFLGTTETINQLIEYNESLRTQHYNHAKVPIVERDAVPRYSVTADPALYETSNTYILVEGSKVYQPYFVKTNIPKVIWADEDVQVAVSEYSTLINEYIKVSDTEFIMGIKDINNDAQWQEYLDELNNMGLQEYIETLYTYYNLK